MFLMVHNTGALLYHDFVKIPGPEGNRVHMYQNMDNDQLRWTLIADTLAEGFIH